MSVATLTKRKSILSTEIATTSAASVVSQVNDLNNGTVSVYSSIKGDDFESKTRVLAATTNSVPLSDHLNETILLKDVVVQAIELTDDEKGTVEDAARVILLAEDGTSYHAVSGGIFKALTNMFGILGEPHVWPGALPVQVVEEKSRRGFKFFTIKLVAAPVVAAKKAAA